MENTENLENLTANETQYQECLDPTVEKALEEASNDMDISTEDTIVDKIDANADAKPNKDESEQFVGNDIEIEITDVEDRSEDEKQEKTGDIDKDSSKMKENQMILKAKGTKENPDTEKYNTKTNVQDLDEYQVVHKNPTKNDAATSKLVLFKKKVFRSGYQQRYQVKNVDEEGNQTRKSLSDERAIDFKIIVEEFRFFWYLLFCFLVLIGIILTRTCTESYFPCEKHPRIYEKLLTSVFGSLNLCVYFDFPPATYVLPTIYSVVVVLAHLYVIAAIFRAWISKEEKRISKMAFKIYCGVMIYFAISVNFFATIFAVPPNLGEDPTTIQIHTIPYTNLCIALCCLQICVTWFGVNVAWTDLNAPRVFRALAIGCTGLLTFTAISKFFLHINALGDVGRCHTNADLKDFLHWKRDICEADNPEEFCGKGLMWQVHSRENIIFSGFVEWTFRLSALVATLCQSGYLYFRHFRTHHIIFSVRDNKQATQN